MQSSRTLFQTVLGRQIPKARAAWNELHGLNLFYSLMLFAS
jgi:hypothetical protein